MSSAMEFNPEIYNTQAEIFIFRFFGEKEYRQFAQYAYENESHIFVCDNHRFTITTDAFTEDEVLRMSKVAAGLSSVSAVSFRGAEQVCERRMWSFALSDIIPWYKS